MVYADGIWVGPNSKSPQCGRNSRKELIDEECGRSNTPVVADFPGGCFADSYDWRDGIGPTDKRPRRTNFWNQGETPEAPASHRYDPNEFGTNEFVHFCQLIGSEPYLAANLRSLSAENFYRWVEYCATLPATAARPWQITSDATAGFKDPFNVRFWGVGNESWGCGGNFTAQEYAVEFRRCHQRWVPRFQSLLRTRQLREELSFIASGPNVDDLGLDTNLVSSRRWRAKAASNYAASMVGRFITTPGI